MRRPMRQWRLVLQQHFVVFGVSSLVVAGSGAVLVAAAPVGPGYGGGAAGDGSGQVCQEMADLAEREVNQGPGKVVNWGCDLRCRNG